VTTRTGHGRRGLAPVWQVEQLPDGSFSEDAAFNAELFAGHSNKPLVMNAGDTIRVHFFVGSKSQGWFIRRWGKRTSGRRTTDGPPRR
jgi:hypothetical protein